MAKQLQKTNKIFQTAQLSLVVLSCFSSAAYALNECGEPPTPDNNVLLCAPSGNPYASGIAYKGINNSITLESGVVVNTTNSPMLTATEPGVSMGVAINAPLATAAGTASLTVKQGASIIVPQSGATVYGLVIRGDNTDNALAPVAVTLSNDGSIIMNGTQGRMITVFNKGNINITNGSTGILEGNSTIGIYAEGAKNAGANQTTTVVNNGKITLTADGVITGIQAVNTNTVAGGVTSVTQAGSINVNSATGVGVRAMMATNGGSLARVIFNNTGSIKSGGVGVVLAAQGSARTSAGSSTGTNSGTIIGTDLAGIKILAPSQFTNTSTGTISGASAVELLTDSNTFLNQGTLSGSTGSGLSTTGLQAPGVAGDPLSGANNTITNEGQISGTVSGVYLTTANNTLTNSGTGTVSSVNNAILISGNSNTVTNTGSISAPTSNAVNVSGNTNTINLNSGSDITGNVLSSGTGNRLNLSGNAAASGNFTGFDALTVAGIGSNWVLSGNVSTVTATNVQDQATLTIGNGQNTGTITGNVNLDAQGKLALNRNDAFSLTAILAGTGSFEHIGSGVTTLNANNSGFNGTGIITQGTIIAGAESSLGGTNTSYQVAAGATLDTATFDTSLTSVDTAGTVIIGKGDTALTLTGAYTQTGTNAVLDLTVRGEREQATLVADSVDLNGTLKITGYSPEVGGDIVKASQLSNQKQLLIQSNSAITGSFLSNVIGKDSAGNDLLAVSTADYLSNGSVRLNDDSTQVLINRLDLTWTDGKASEATGNFTLEQGSAFEVDVDLANRTGITSGWSGQDLTKLGEGKLVLSGTNTYTGRTNIHGGELSVSSGQNLGGTEAVQLGSTLATDPAATLTFESNNAAITTNNDFSPTLELADRNDNRINVLDAGSIINWTGSITGGGFTKTGAGQFTITPTSGNTISYTGDTIVEEGSLAFQAETTPLDLNTNIYVLGAVGFDAINDIRLTGNVQAGLSSLARSLVAGQAEKSGAGTLLLIGDSLIDWNITAGTLAVTSETFNSSVTMSDNTVLSFTTDSSVTTPLVARYNGLLTGTLSSTLEMNRAGASLSLEYNQFSRIGRVNVEAGHLDFIQADAQPAPETGSVNRFEISGDLDVQDSSSVAIKGSDTYLAVGGNFNLYSNSRLDVALDSIRPTAGDITVAGMTTIGTNTSLNLIGFAVPLNYNPDTDVNFSKVFKASQLPDYEYLVIDSAQTIQGEFANPVANTTINNPSYILYELQYRDDVNGAPNSEVWLGNFRLAWLEGGSQYGTGTFDMEEGTALNIDVPLPTMTGPFTSGWDGNSLEKTGKGLLILSNPDNSYTGTTTLNNGTLLTGADDVLDNSSSVIVGPQGTLDVHNSTQHVNHIDSTGTIELDQTGEIIISNLAPNGDTLVSHLGGTVTGGNRLHDDGTDSTIRVDNGGLTVDGNVDVDHLIFAPNTKVEVNQGGSLTGQTDGGDASIIVNNGGTWAITDDSVIGSVELNGGVIDFGNPLQNLGEPGRTLTVDNWTGNGGSVNLYGEDNNGMPKNDQIIINGQTSGNTELRLIDTGGLADLVSGGTPITLVKPGPNGQIKDDVFSGTFITGFEELEIGLDANGSVVINPSKPSAPDDKVGNTTDLGRQYLALVGGLTQGQTASAVTSLGNFGNALDNTESGSCSVRQAFGTISGANGKTSQASSLSRNDYRQYNLLAGSDVYGTEFANGCLRVGAMLGYSDSSNDIDHNGVDLGRNSIDSKQLGAYARYSDANNWYATVAAMHYWDDIRVASRQDQERSLDSTAWALSLEVGKKHSLGTQWSITPSAQIIYQNTSLDDVKTSQHITQFDSVSSTFTRLGAKANYQATATTKIIANFDLWHQLASSQTIHAKALTTGQRLNSLSEKESHSWGDIGIGIESVNKGLTIFGKLGYQGDFSNTNAVTGKLGIRYRW